jgi:hypothetical protein
MTRALYPDDPREFAAMHLGGADLNDPRRTRRAVRLAAAAAATPGLSVPLLCEGRSAAFNAVYDLFKRQEATPERLQAGHRGLVAQAMAEPGAPVLLIQDTTVPGWSGKAPIEGLGPIGGGRRGQQGFFLHSMLAARWPAVDEGTAKRPPLEILGLVDQQSLVRSEPGALAGRWERSARAAGPAPQGARWVEIADREADIYEFLALCAELGHGFVVRAMRDRTLEAGGRLFAAAAAGRPVGRLDLDLRARKGQRARAAHLRLLAASVVLAPPPRSKTARGPLAVTVMRVFEEQPPEGHEGLEWTLVCDHPVTTPEAACETVRMYAARWLIEDFHKALKTGLGAEDLQLATAHRLMAAIAILSVVALRLVALREHVRCAPEAPAAAAGLSALALRVLAHRVRKPLSTVRDVMMALGRLGGHPGRRGDGLPGWRQLWWGWQRLDALVQGVEIAGELGRSQE